MPSKIYIGHADLIFNHTFLSPNTDTLLEQPDAGTFFLSFPSATAAPENYERLAVRFPLHQLSFKGLIAEFGQCAMWTSLRMELEGTAAR